MPLEVGITSAEPESLGERRREWLERSLLYLVCDTRPAGRDLEEFLRAALQGGVDVVQLRDKDAGERDAVEAGRVFRRLCDAYDALFIVNDDPELAVACAADGVHLGQDDRSVGEARAELGRDALIGLSTHSPKQIAAAGGADYIAVGPVYRTPTKPEYAPVGLDLVRTAAERAPAPFFAIGGIDAATVGEVLDAGAERIAVVRAICEADEPGESARLLKSAVEAKARVGTR